MAEIIKEIILLGKAFDLLKDHVVITDKDANILYANKAAEEATGFSNDEMIGKNPGELWGGNMPRKFFREMWHVIKEEKKPFVGEVQNKRKDGKEYWQEIHISPVLNEDGEVKFFIGIEPNITEKKYQEKFREEFMSIISHQIQNPLTAIRWLLDLLFARGGISGQQHEILKDVYRYSKSLSSLIDDLLTLSQIEKGTSEKVIDLRKNIEKKYSRTKHP